MRHAALAPSLAAAYIFDNGFQEWIDFDSGSDNNRTKNRPAKDRRITLGLSQRQLLRVLEQSKGQALVPEHAQDPGGRTKRQG